MQNYIFKDTSENNKDLWIVLQDMSKTFDTIYIPTLSKAMRCIHLPEKFISLITFLLTNCTNQVITEYGLTNKYNVRDGIDQGETISPILWRIFYDPLISRIDIEHIGYNIKSRYPDKIQDIHTSVMAYMDDSVWITHNKRDLLNILDTANSFYTLHNIQVNPQKSVFYTNSKSTDATITF